MSQTLWTYNQNPILDGTALYGGYDSTSVSGTIKYYEKREKIKVLYVKRGKQHKRPFEKGIEY